MKISDRAVIEHCLDPKRLGAPEDIPSCLEKPSDPRTALLEDITEAGRIRGQAVEPNETEQVFIDDTRARAWWWAVEQFGLTASDEIRIFLEQELDRSATR